VRQQQLNRLKANGSSDDIVVILNVPPRPSVTNRTTEPKIPALFASRSDKKTISASDSYETQVGLQWQQADYV
jgi:hypothetical protein